MRKLSDKKKYGLLGERLEHSFSPGIHARLADYEYLLYEKSPEELQDFLKNGDFAGLNVTMPYKKTVIPYCAELSDNARKIGSVNTLLRREDGTLYGDNADYFGFSFLLAKVGADIRGKKALVLGSGGASLTVCAVLRDGGAGEVIVISRGGVDNYDNIARHHDAVIIVNTTPVGMYPDNGASPIDLSGFISCRAVIDVVYNPAKTELVLQAEDMGIPCSGGLAMLTAQAKHTAENFLGEKIDDGVIDIITAALERETKNVVLIGMPGCGKSTIGAELSRLTGRELFDMDALIVERAGKPIPQIFAEDGETAFRQMETDVLRDLSKKCGCIIATGGGIVKDDANRRLVRQNSVTVYLRRDVEELATDGRPLSAKHGVAALARERLPLYERWSDFTVNVTVVDKTARDIKEILSL